MKSFKDDGEDPHKKNLQRLKKKIENDPEKFGGKESAAELLETWAKSDLRYGHQLTPDRPTLTARGNNKMVKAHPASTD